MVGKSILRIARLAWGANAASSRASNVNGENNGGRGACLHPARPVH